MLRLFIYFVQVFFKYNLQAFFKGGGVFGVLCLVCQVCMVYEDLLQEYIVVFDVMLMSYMCVFLP